MPTIAVTSDLHLGITSEDEIRALADSIASQRPDLTVLAGDIGERLANFERCLQLFTQMPGEVAVLAGNHDVWARGGYQSRDLWEHHLPAAVHNAGMLWLEDAVWQHSGVAVLGSLAWYDYSAADPTLPPYPPEYFEGHKADVNLDARFVNWTWHDREFASRLGDALCERLAQTEADPNTRATLLVTHVPLFDEQMLRKPDDPRWGLGNAFFGNLTLGRRVLDTRKLRAVISGHTHIGRTGVVTRPGAPDLPAVAVSVVASDYGSPAYVVVDDTQLGGELPT